MEAFSPMSLDDKLAADAFGKSYREFLALKPGHYRWSKLAPQNLAFLREADDLKWSMEKLADYLQCPVAEAELCLRRYVMSKKVNAKATTAARIKQAFFEWSGRFGDLGEKEREALAAELSLLVANQLHAAALLKENLQDISEELEGAPKEDPGMQEKKTSESRPWGPQWKD